MAYKIEGTLRLVLPIWTKGSFSKREFVLDVDDGRYPQVVKMECTGELMASLDEYNVGDYVEATFDIRGKEWTNPQGETRYFVSLNAWRLVPVLGARREEEPEEEPEDDIPF